MVPPFLLFKEFHYKGKSFYHLTCLVCCNFLHYGIYGMTVRVVVFYFFFVCFFYVFCCGAECYAQKPVGARQFGGDFFYGRMVYERLSVFVGGGIFVGGGVFAVGGGVFATIGGVLTTGGGLVLFCRGTELLFCIFCARRPSLFYRGRRFLQSLFRGFCSVNHRVCHTLSPSSSAFSGVSIPQSTIFL